MKTYAILLTAIIFSACQSEQSLSPKISENLYQYFEIDCTKDTILRSEEGVLIHIESNTFDCENGNQVKLRFVAIDKKHEMVLNHFYTLRDEKYCLVWRVERRPPRTCWLHSRR